jgi:hypothetical protein
MARNDRSSCVILDHACPLDDQRQVINPDVLVWMRSGDEAELEPPQYYDFELLTADDESVDKIIKKIETKKITL